MKNFIPHAQSSASVGFPPETDQPIRADLFSIERLEQHAESLAEAQRITTRRGAGRGLAKRLQDNSRVLLEAYRATAKAAREERAITPAVEWLIDNFYVAQEQIRQIRVDLPRGFYRRGLPKLAEGPPKGYPRVFGVAWAFVAHTDSRFEPEMLCRFVKAYQRVQPLTIGELWAVAITLRVVLVENLRRAAERIANDRATRETADMVADQLLRLGGHETEAPEVVLQRFNAKPVPRAFAVQLVQRLRDRDPKVTPALTWLDERLVDPSIPKTWRHFEIVSDTTLRGTTSRSNLQGVSRGVSRVELDGKLLQGSPLLIPLSDDGATHSVRVLLGDTSRVGELPVGGRSGLDEVQSDS